MLSGLACQTRYNILSWWICAGTFFYVEQPTSLPDKLLRPDTGRLQSCQVLHKYDMVWRRVVGNSGPWVSTQSGGRLSKSAHTQGLVIPFYTPPKKPGCSCCVAPYTQSAAFNKMMKQRQTVLRRVFSSPAACFNCHFGNLSSLVHNNAVAHIRWLVL